MIKTYLFTPRGMSEDVALDDWESLVKEDCALLWVDVRAYDRQEIEQLAARFGLHPVAVDSCIDGYRRPHLYEFSDHFYVNLTLVASGGHSEHGIKISELHLFAGAKFVITAVRDRANKAIDQAIEVYKDAPKMCERGPMWAVYLLAEDLVETYFPIVEKLDDEADRLETVMLDKADRGSLHKLFTLKRRGFELRKLLGPQRDVFSEFARRDFPFMEGESRVYSQDLYSRMNRIFDMLDTIREILSGSLDIYLSTISNRLNEVMKVLTVAATVLMTLSLITGFFGMNFVYLPWLKSPNAFRNNLIFMGAITAAMLWWARRKKWL
jgi:magnesium transporter